MAAERGAPEGGDAVGVELGVEAVNVGAGAAAVDGPVAVKAGGRGANVPLFTVPAGHGVPAPGERVGSPSAPADGRSNHVHGAVGHLSSSATTVGEGWEIGGALSVALAQMLARPRNLEDLVSGLLGAWRRGWTQRRRRGSFGAGRGTTTRGQVRGSARDVSREAGRSRVQIKGVLRFLS